MEDDDRGGTAPCTAHLLINGEPIDPTMAQDVARFRTAERARLMAARRRLSTDDRAQLTATLAETLASIVAPQSGMKIAVYWPIRGEPDLRGWMTQAHDAGADVLLPVVVEKNAPLIFRTWSPDCAMTRGIWNIPVPAQGSEETPDIVISPLLGVDRSCFRLGNGGGYYDRTLAQFRPRPRIIGVGFPDCVMETIFPMPWDIAMDTVVLADGMVYGQR